MKQYSKQEGISDQTVEKINSTWTNYLSQIEGTSDIHRVDALTVYSNDAKEKYERTIQREVDAHYQNNNGNEDTSSTVADPKPVQKVRITSLVKPARIENEQDIANYLNKLSRELKQRIQMHQIIEIID